MSIDSDIRTTLRQVAREAATPSIDEVEFERRVRRHRRRRRVGYAGATAAVAVVALAVPLVVNHIASDDGSSPSPITSGSTESDRSPTYFLVGGRAMMLDPSGVTHDIGLRADGIVAQTGDGVIVSGPNGLVRLRATRAGDEWSFEQLPLPVQDAQSAALSADGTRLAVIDPGEDLVVYDLESGDVQSRTPNSRPATVLGFSDLPFSHPVLWTVDGRLLLGVGADAVEIPLYGASPLDSAVAGMGLNSSVVAVGDWATTRLYDVGDGDPSQIGEVRGMGDLSPDGRYYLAAAEEAPATVWQRGGVGSRPLRGLDGAAEQVRWLDYDAALVATGTLRHGEQVTLLFVCEASTLRCHEIYDAGTSTVSLGD